ncbi:MAG: type II secretion system protein GspG [Silvanigrellaceae bacterium]|nr:type II secretion system protein GspG [Silvanigrellaceae bacterium]
MKFKTILNLVRKKKKNSHVHLQLGFSLLEIIIVLAIIGTLMGIVISQLGSSNQRAKIKETTIKAGTISSALMQYQVDVGKFPSTTEGLNVLRNNPGNGKWSGPYINSEGDLNDAWGNSFDYELSPKGPLILSHGPDGVVGNEDDMRFINGRLEEKATTEQAK